MKMNKNSNFKEVDTIEEANKVDMDVYRWSERMSAAVGKFIFARRMR